MVSITNESAASLCPDGNISSGQLHFDLSRGYIPVLVAAVLFSAGAGLAFRAGGWLEDFKQERSAVLARLDKIEAKLDAIASWSKPPRHAQQQNPRL